MDWHSALVLLEDHRLDLGLVEVELANHELEGQFVEVRMLVQWEPHLHRKLDALVVVLGASSVRLVGSLLLLLHLRLQPTAASTVGSLPLDIESWAYVSR